MIGFSRIAVCEPNASLSFVGLIHKMETQAAIINMDIMHVKKTLVVDGTPVFDVGTGMSVSLLPDNISPNNNPSILLFFLNDECTFS